MKSLRRVAASGLLVLLHLAAVSCGGDDGKKGADVTGSGGSGDTDADVDATAGAGGTDGGVSEAGADATAADADAARTEYHCGDGNLNEDEGEECDLGSKNGLEGENCTGQCRWVCTFVEGEVAAECNNGEFCDGEEVCSPDHKCLPAEEILPNGTQCGDAHRCKNGACEIADAVCGDKLIVPPTEECDDGNDVNGDGCDDCRYSCVTIDPERDCKPKDPCEGDASCDNRIHRCSERTPEPDLTPCGDGKACIGGVCRSEYCGNHKIEAGEECDDGNQFDADGCDSCKYSCVPNDSGRDCTPTNECMAKSACSVVTHTCAPFAPKAPGTLCDSGDKYCLSGNCVAPICGDGVKGPGEACDDGNTAKRDGCTTACAVDCVAPGSCDVGSCDSDADCTDGDPCNGAEVCNPANNTCHNGSPPAEGTLCGSAPRRVCIAGDCQVSVCGDGYRDKASGSTEECDPPNVGSCDSACKALETCNLGGTWAIKIVADATWGSDEAIVKPGQGQIVSTSRAQLTMDGAAFTAKLKPCSITLPDFITSDVIDNIKGEHYGLRFDTSMDTVPETSTAGGLSNLSPGATVNIDRTAVLIGADMPNPFDTVWPSAIDFYVNPDLYGAIDKYDFDTTDGVLRLGAHVKTGAIPGSNPPDTYDYVAVDPNQTPIARAQTLGLILRQISSQTARLTTCNTMTGVTTDMRIDSHVLDCVRSTGVQCTADEILLADGGAPTYTIRSATFEAKKLSSGAGCSAVAGAL